FAAGAGEPNNCAEAGTAKVAAPSKPARARDGTEIRRRFIINARSKGCGAAGTTCPSTRVSLTSLFRLDGAVSRQILLCARNCRHLRHSSDAGLKRRLR